MTVVQLTLSFGHFDLEPLDFSTPGNDPYNDYYEPGWKNPHNFSWEALAMRNLPPYSHRLHNQAYPQFNNQVFYPPSNFHPPH
jgi:hypothetical protein